MSRYGILVDMNRCNGCYGCFLACRDEHCGNDHLPYTAAQPYSGHFWMRIAERERGSYPKVKMSYTKILCMHCDEPTCVKQAPDAVYKRPDGIVIIDPVKAIGRKDILDACPYRVIYWNEEKQLPQKCTMCAHLIDQGWEEPRCVEVCPNKALIFGDFDDPDSEVSKRLAAEKGEALHPEYGLKERVLYLGLPKQFIAGSVIFGDTVKCAGGVTVSLTGEGEKMKAETNNFGDFEFEGLSRDKEYTVQVRHKGYRSASIKVQPRIDTYLRDIVLQKTASK